MTVMQLAVRTRGAVYSERFATRLGPMLGAVDDRGAVAQLVFLGDRDGDATAALRATRAMRALERTGRTVVARRGACERLAREVDEYLRGARRELGFELALDGTPFQLEVWRALREVPYGTTCSYRELAERIGRPTACRAVARANATNPVSLAVPCHRVIGSDGSLTGYGGGLPIKRALLELERRVATR